MAVMLGNLYDALISAGAADDKARKAAEEMAGYENRFSKLDADMALVKWMVGFSLGLNLIVVGLVLRLGGLR